MLRKTLITGFFILLVGLSTNGLSEADSIKLKNGSQFEGRIIEDTGQTLRMKMGVGMVEFSKDDISEVTNSPEVETLEIEAQWENTGSTDEEALSEDQQLEKYLNKGKVKYQGRWISEEVHEVMKKEQEIKEKRYRFMEEKKRRDETERREKAHAQMKASSNEGALNIKSPKGRLSGFKSFGGREQTDKNNDSNKTQFLPSGRENASIPGIGGLRQGSAFGNAQSKQFASTSNRYSRKE